MFLEEAIIFSKLSNPIITAVRLSHAFLRAAVFKIASTARPH